MTYSTDLVVVSFMQELVKGEVFDYFIHYHLEANAEVSRVELRTLSTQSSVFSCLAGLAASYVSHCMEASGNTGRFIQSRISF